MLIRKLFVFILKKLRINKDDFKIKIGRLTGHSIVYNVNKEIRSNRCLLIYITEPFFEKKIKEVHQNQWQVMEMARVIGVFGYIVDVANYQDKNLKLKYNYDLIVGLIPRGIDIYSNHMNPGCLRVAYLTSMNLTVTSSNEERRLENLQERRGVKLQLRRFAGYIQKEIEEFDAAWYIGNKYNFHSYDSFKMPPTFYIKNNGYAFNFENTSKARNPKKFLFFGSSGAVHKGLDLLLELFADNLPDCSLYVCGCYLKEEDFCEEYKKELFQTPNIHSMGFVDIESGIYKELANEVAYTLLPSCAEGCAGSVLTNMSAGIIPIVSRECGFEDDEVINLPDCNKETILNYIREYSCKDKQWIVNSSEHTVKIVRERYSKASFSKSVEEAMKGLLYKNNEHSRYE